MAAPIPPAGTFAPGTKVQVGSHKVTIEKYLSEGGFAHVYVVRIPNVAESAVLKRVAVPDKESLANMRTEVETMKKLKGHKFIVTYLDSHASQLKAGGYEVFLLMEYCDGGGLIDFMNTRLKNRLTEPEILHIFSDTAEGVACMHYLKPPLLHRDLKVENILVKRTGSTSMYKLCDFGSSAPPRPAASSAAEGRLIEEDVQRHTTLQYRSPEMIDVYRKRPIDEKSDIWALGVLLYKLCYYTTPFEEQGQMAILSASFKYPAYPPFSDRLKKLIAMTLAEDPRRRPNIYQVIKEVCAMRNEDVPIKDIYAQRTHSEAKNNQQMPPAHPNLKSSPMVGATLSIPEQSKQVIPEVKPMRRGRPTAVGQQPPINLSTSPGKPNTDPFAALDSKNYATRSAAVDELAAKFPALDQFSLLQKSDSKFKFEGSSPIVDKTPKVDLRVANALADEAFATASPPNVGSIKSPPPISAKTINVQKQRPAEKPRIEMPVIVDKPLPDKPKTGYVSTGTMTSRNSSPIAIKPPKNENQSIWRVPKVDSPRFSSISRFDSLSRRPRLGSRPMSFHYEESPKSPASSRPSLESLRVSGLDVPDSVQRSRSANSRPQETEPVRRGSVQRDLSRSAPSDHAVEDIPITSDVDFLRAMEEEEAAHRGHHRSLSRSQKHTSLPSISLHGTRNALAGKFGDAFRRFEHNRSNSRSRQPSDDVPPDRPIEVDERPLTPDSDMDETTDLPPEMRRELERQRLSTEEKRVASGAQAYRARLAAGEPATRPNRASAIQDRVKNLLDESGRTSPVKRTASGYGRFTASADDVPSQPVPQAQSPSQPRPLSNKRPSAPPKPVALRTPANNMPIPRATGNPAMRSDDDAATFAKRYPRMSLELVETEIEVRDRGRGVRVRDV